MAIDIAWSGVTFWRGMHVGAWIYIDTVIIVALCGTLWYAHGKHWYEKGRTMLPSYILLVLLGITTAFSYWLEADIYFP
jgi:hypothetical protein